MLTKKHIENANIKNIVKDSMAPSGKSFLGFIKINGDCVKIWFDSKTFELIWCEFIRPQQDESIKNPDFSSPIV